MQHPAVPHSDRGAASKVFLTIPSGSLPGTKVVMKATVVPASGTTGTGSRATSVACALDATFIVRNNSISPIETSMTTSMTAMTGPAPSRLVQCAGCISHTSGPSETSGAAPSSSAARTRCGSSASRLR